MLSIFLNNHQIMCAEEVKKPCCAAADSEISVNCIFSVGQTCRSAYHILKHGKRFQASPLDWMRDYSLDTCLHLFKTKFSDFFEKIEEKPPWPGSPCKSVNDAKNNILSIHHFSKEKTIKEDQPRVSELMKKRADKVDKILKKSDAVALVYHQDSMPSESENKKMIEFITGFGDIYPNKKIYFINIASSDIKDFKKEVIFEKDNLKIIRFTFWDAGPDWTGNHDAWAKVINYIKLVKNSDKTKN